MSKKKINKLLSDSKVTEAQIDKLKRQKIEFESLILQRNNKIALSCMLLIYSPTETTYLFGGSITQFQKYSGQFLIQYEAMKRSIQKRIYRYNFLGIEGNFNGRDGVLRFKQNFNGFIERKYGIFRYHPRPIKYFFINLLKKIKKLFFIYKK
uniref:peptidoglycan bridge formation glycyltransferase FemA/FemB family protein n=1 Tax=Streptococcus uberis TaxID=1349 RepID=UPI003CCFE71E